MKGSTNTQNAGSYGQQSSQRITPAQVAMSLMMPGFSQNTASGMGTKGSGIWDYFRNRNSGTQQTPEYVNYQQMPTYSSQPVAPSDALTKFLASGYASGGTVGAEGASSLEDDIKAALRLARLIGELTKKE